MKEIAPLVTEFKFGMKETTSLIEVKFRMVVLIELKCGKIETASLVIRGFQILGNLILIQPQLIRKP